MALRPVAAMDEHGRTTEGWPRSVTAMTRKDAGGVVGMDGSEVCRSHGFPDLREAMAPRPVAAMDEQAAAMDEQAAAMDEEEGRRRGGRLRWL